MANEKDVNLPQPPRGRRAVVATDARIVRRIGARIFAELLPRSQHSLAAGRTARPPQPASSGAGGQPPERPELSFDTPVHGPHPSARRAQKEPSPMKVYRTESRYYFSSRQLLPAGSLVFFSDKLRRYVHPTAGTLLDPHPRLQSVSEAESQEFEAHWHGRLS
jgi:hypothetical protein